MYHWRRTDDDQQQQAGCSLLPPPATRITCADRISNIIATAPAAVDDYKSQLEAQDYYYHVVPAPLGVSSSMQQQQQPAASGVAVLHSLSSPAPPPPHFNSSTVISSTTGAGDASVRPFGLPLIISPSSDDQLKLAEYSCTPLLDEYGSNYYCCGDNNSVINSILNVECSSSSSSYDFITFTTAAAAATNGPTMPNEDEEVDTGFWDELGPLLPSFAVHPYYPTLTTTTAQQPHNHSPAVAVNIVPTQEKTKAAVTTLTRESVSRYFYMPITQAARELNVGLTVLKKRCRELGVRRWPHRKLASLQTLISNVRRLSQLEGGASHDHHDNRSARLKEAIRVLEKERQLLEQCPDLQLQRNTKRLRQACFKANYKKNKKRNNFNSTHHNAPAAHHSINPSLAAASLSYAAPSTTFAEQEEEEEEEEEEDDEEINSLLQLPVLDGPNNFKF